MTGTDASSATPRRRDPLLAGVRRLARSPTRPPTPRTILRGAGARAAALARAPRRCTSTISQPPGAEAGAGGRLPVRGRRAPELPAPARPSARPGSAGWRAPGAASSPPTPRARRERAAAGRRPAQSRCALLLPLAERGDAAAVVMLVRRLAERASTSARSSSPATLVDQAATALALVRARAEAGHRRGHRLHEPPRDAPAPGRGDRPRGAHRQPAVVPADRPRRLQARQRPPRPPGRRRGAAAASCRRWSASSAPSTASRATAATSSS